MESGFRDASSRVQALSEHPPPCTQPSSSQTLNAVILPNEVNEAERP